MKICLYLSLMMVCCYSSGEQLKELHPMHPLSSLLIEKKICLDPLFDQEDVGDIKYSIDRWNMLAKRTNVWMNVSKTDCQWTIIRGLQSEERETCKTPRAMACTIIG